MSNTGFSIKPTRRFFRDTESQATDYVDDFGFLNDVGMIVTVGIDELLSPGIKWITAPPWFGKSYVANRLDRFLEESPVENRFAEFNHLTTFHQFGYGCDVRPPWWINWQNQAGCSCWIIDAVDEDQHLSKAIFRVIELIRPLGEARSRLCLLMFCRQSEEPADVIEALSEIDPSKRGDFTRWQLAPPTAWEATQIAGGEEKLEIVKGHISRNSLSEMGRYPAAIEWLARQPPVDRITERNLWTGIVKELLRGGQRERRVDVPPIETQFRSACRIAAVMTLACLPEFDATHASPWPSMDAMFSRSHVDRDLVIERSVVRTALFARTAVGYRFAEQHVREWLAAFALEDLEVNQLRGLLAKGDKPIPQLMGVMAILQRVSRQAGVKKWLIELNGGVAPRADSIPWTLRQSIAALDRLQELARQSPYGLHFWEDKGLDRLAARGFGKEVASRLMNNHLCRNEKNLLLRVAIAVNALEVVPAMITIIKDEEEEDDVRTTASYYLRRLGNAESFGNLAEFVRSANPSSPKERARVSNIILGLMTNGIWHFSEAYRFAPESDSGYGDATAVLEDRLKKAMSLDDARSILHTFEWERQSELKVEVKPEDRIRIKHHGALSFALHAVNVLLKQEQIQGSDFEILSRMVLANDRTFAFNHAVQTVVKAMQDNREARRELFRAGIAKYPDHTPASCWHWKFILRPEDIEWLVLLAQAHSDKSPWLWESVLGLANHLNEEARNTVRRTVQELAPSVLEELDTRQQHARDAHERAKREQEEQERAQRRELHPIEQVVNRIIDADAPQHVKLHQLAWVCFEENDFRPNDIAGQFKDLGQDFRTRVLATCASILQDMTPTPIPDINSYPADIVHEASAFSEILRSGVDYNLTSDEIRKWLPSTLLFGHPDRSDILFKCLATDRDATEEVLLDTFRREIRSQDDGGSTASNLPAECWSEQLGRRSLSIIDDATLSQMGRANLLRILSLRFPKLALPVARNWLQESADASPLGRIRRIGAIDTLLISSPLEGMNALVETIGELGSDVLSELRSISRHSVEGTPSLQLWPTGALELLAGVLYQTFPSDQDPKDEHGVVRWVSVVDELRTIRDSIGAILLERGEPDDIGALERLAGQHEHIRKWYESARADNAARELLDPARSDPDGIPWPQAVRLLDDARYRVIRDSSDLQRVLVEELQEIAKTAKLDLSMLYRADNRNKTQHEDALRDYIRCRLSDRLPRGVLDKETMVSVIMNCEPLAAAQKELDIKVEAPTVDGGNAIVVVEIKWSHNSEVVEGLKDQLGRRYLLANRWSHGIYFVGYAEPPTKRKNATSRAPVDWHSLEAWQQFFDEEAAMFHQENPNIQITPLVVDLRWS